MNKGKKNAIKLARDFVGLISNVDTSEFAASAVFTEIHERPSMRAAWDSLPFSEQQKLIVTCAEIIKAVYEDEEVSRLKSIIEWIRTRDPKVVDDAEYFCEAKHDEKVPH